MTDSEIVKALEYLTYGGNYCLRCEHKIITGDHRCGIDGCHIAKKALDLINQLKAENSELQRKNVELQYENLQMIASIKKIKSEAIKEFAERLCEGRVSNDPVVIAVKVELEEMTERKDEGK